MHMCYSPRKRFQGRSYYEEIYIMMERKRWRDVRGLMTGPEWGGEYIGCGQDRQPWWKSFAGGPFFAYSSWPKGLTQHESTNLRTELQITFRQEKVESGLGNILLRAFCYTTSSCLACPVFRQIWSVPLVRGTTVRTCWSCHAWRRRPVHIRRIQIRQLDPLGHSAATEFAGEN